MPTNAVMIAANAERFAKAKIRPEWQRRVDEAAKRLVAPENKARFQVVERRTKVPWPIVAVIKEREAGEDLHFLLSIAQGDRWDRKSRHVPAGRGPFANWDEAADDALIKCAPFAAHWTDWSAGGSMTILIKYNGVGYEPSPSPYGYSATNIYVKGKFVADHKFDPEAVDQQIGCAALLLAMLKLDQSIVFAAPGSPPRATPEPPKEIVDEATKAARNTRKGAIAGGAATGGNEAAKTTSGTQVPASSPLLPSPVAYSLLGVAVVVVIVATVIAARRKAAVLNIW